MQVKCNIEMATENKLHNYIARYYHKFDNIPYGYQYIAIYPYIKSNLYS